MKRLDTIFEEARSAVADVEFTAAREWQDAAPGRRCYGYFPVYFPVELIHAAGALPVGVWGGGDQIEVELADARVQSFICSVSRSTLELGLTGRLDFLDGMFFSSLCDVARNLSGVWARNFPGRLCEYFHYPQNPRTPTARGYYREELQRLGGLLAGRTGNEVTADRLQASLDAYEEQRALLRELAALRRAEPWRLGLQELYLLVRSSALRDVREQNEVLRHAFSALKERECRARDGVRVVLEGSFCEQPPLELLEVLDQAHCFVVDSDLARGVTWHREPLTRTDDPWADLAQGYFDCAEASVVRHRDCRERSERLVERVRGSDAAGVVFCTAKFCEPAFYDFVLHKRALEKEGIPFMAVEFEEKMSSFESIRTQAETFSESILFFADEVHA